MLKPIKKITIEYSGVIKDGHVEVLGVEGFYADGSQFHAKVGYVVQGRFSNKEEVIESIMVSSRIISAFSKGDDSESYHPDVADMVLLRPHK